MMQLLRDEKEIYKIVHYYDEDDSNTIYVLSDIILGNFIRILGAIHFKFEELVDEHGCMDARHLLEVLQKFYGVENLTEDMKHLNSKLSLNKEDWEVYNVFSLNLASGQELLVAQIDWYSARESCCGSGYKELMSTYLPQTKEFDDAISNTKYY